ncbi:MAG TPA: FAD-binding oxidoreductase [Myxococcota bacterium]|nr:FAD-binding oxidoreductase [Myxococcota bacterium]
MELDPQAPRIVPDPPAPDPADEESPDVWGFRDTRFIARTDGVVVLTGSRYPLSGQELPELLAWTQRQIHPDVRPDDLNRPHYPPAIPEPRRHAAFLDELRKSFAEDQLREDPELRLRHGHGHTQEEMYAIKYGRLERVPDLVVFPAEDAQVERLVDAAVRHDVVLIPYGGGTNVTDALRCRVDEQRSIVSVDMRRMNRILWIDPVNRMACIQAGAVGREIAAGLAKHGFTMGHEPDSVEFSTLGGWIATHASGMKKNRYGNIEDLVLDVRVVTAQGVLERPAAHPRESVGGADARRFVFGSEGCLGIVTQAVVKLFPLPEAQVYGSIVFPDFPSGVRFLYELEQAGGVPASVRLVDNLQFQLSQMLKPRKQGLARLVSQAEKLFVTRWKGFDVERMTACTMVFEGTKAEVAAQQERTGAIAKRHGGVAGGAANGERGYQLTFGIAYLRDWILNHYLIAESFETSVPWSRVLELCEAVKQRIRDEHAARGLPGKPFVTCRVTQLYPTGVCVYFYFAFYFKGVSGDPSELYAEIEHAARDEVLARGGSLSHHHGIGKIRQPFLGRIASPALRAFARQVKQAVDPKNVFGADNQLFGREREP